MTPFEQSLADCFPGALPSAEYLERTRATLEPFGFDRERTLTLVSICRDELTTVFFDQIEEDWGLAFTLAGLGGIPALGTTGWRAALSHVPDGDGRGCLLVFGFPHIGIEEDGTFAADCFAHQQLLATSAEGPDGLELEIADSGPGLSDEVQRRVFEPFFTTKNNGTGLGLAIVYRVAEAHGGEVRVQNCPEGGAAFTLRLPRRARADPWLPRPCVSSRPVGLRQFTMRWLYSTRPRRRSSARASW